MIHSFIKRRTFLMLFSFFFVFLHSTMAHCTPSRPLVIKIFSSNNKYGFQLDREILKEQLEKLGHTVIEKEFNDHSYESSDINIFVHKVLKKQIGTAQINWFMPNPECFTQKAGSLVGINLILCRTHLAEEIFQKMEQPTYYLGFTSQDLHSDTIEKDYSQYLHVAGRSPYKGTNEVIQTWNKDPTLTNLTIVDQRNKSVLTNPNVNWIKRWIPFDQLYQLKNSCGFHLCPSTAEGYGHYIVEAMSAGVVIITTDAPPMNEFITDPRCLVPYSSTAPCGADIRHYVTPEDLRKTIDSLKQLSIAELQEIGEHNRTIYFEKQLEFYQNLELLMDTVDL